MGKGIVAFVLLTAIIAGCTLGFRSLAGKEKWELVKLLAFSAGCSIIAVMILTVIVILF